MLFKHTVTQVVALAFMLLALVACSPIVLPTPSATETENEQVTPTDSAGDDQTVTATDESALIFAPRLTGVSNFAKDREPANQLAEYLANTAGESIRAFVPTDYGNTLLGLEKGELDIVYLPSPFFVKAQTELGATAGLVVNVNGSATETGLILVATDAAAQELVDLANMRIAASDIDSAAAWVVPAAALKEAGVNPFTQVDSYFSDNDVSSLQALLEGEADAAFVRSTVLEDSTVREAYPDLANQVRVLAEFPDLPIGVIAYAADVTEAQQAAISQALLDAVNAAPVTDNEGEEKSLLNSFGWDDFVAVDDVDFSVVQEAAKSLGMIKE